MKKTSIMELSEAEILGIRCALRGDGYLHLASNVQCGAASGLQELRVEELLEIALAARVFRGQNCLVAAARSTGMVKHLSNLRAIQLSAPYSALREIERLQVQAGRDVQMRERGQLRQDNAPI